MMACFNNIKTLAFQERWVPIMSLSSIALSRPGAPFSPSLSKNLLIYLILGLLAAAATVAVLEILDDTFKSPEEIEEQLGLPVLGIIPKTAGKYSVSDQGVAGITDR